MGGRHANCAGMTRHPDAQRALSSLAGARPASLLTGADSWITRPVRDEELLARVRLQLRQGELRHA